MLSSVSWEIFQSSYSGDYVWSVSSRNSLREVFFKIDVLKNFAFIGKYLWLTMAQVCSCKFYKIFNNTYFTEHLWTSASGLLDFLDLMRHNVFRSSFSSILDREYYRKLSVNIFSHLKYWKMEIQMNLHSSLFYALQVKVSFFMFHCYSSSLFVVPFKDVLEFMSSFTYRDPLTL